ncbi:MAG: PAS domain S-box protein, partial [Methanobacterium sp.]|nr:PAS domain S-box protein [Methanobacterium sp.]
IALIFTNRGYLLKNKFAYPLIYGPALLFILFGFTTDLLIGPPILEYWGWTYSIPENPLIYYLFSAWTVIVSLTASIMVFSYYFKTEGMDKKQALYLALGLFTPLILSLVTDFIFIKLSIPIPEFTQTLLTLGLIFIVYGIWRYNFPLLTLTLAAEKIISTMPNFLVLLDPKGRVSKINKSVISQLGYSEKELLKQMIYDIFSLENKSQLEKAIKNGESFNGECTIISNSGKAVDVLINLAPIYSIIKEPTGFVIIGTDITQRKKALQEIVESELKFRSIIEQTSDGVALANNKGKIIYWNHALENITGYSKDEVTGLYLYEILYKMITLERKKLISKDSIQKIFERAFASSKIPNKLHMQEKLILRADGTSRDTQVINFFLEKTNPSLFCTVVRDISDRKKAENILK